MRFARTRGVELEMKPFAMGVRVEHPQELNRQNSVSWQFKR